MTWQTISAGHYPLRLGHARQVAVRPAVLPVLRVTPPVRVGGRGEPVNDVAALCRPLPRQRTVCRRLTAWPARYCSQPH